MKFLSRGIASLLMICLIFGVFSFTMINAWADTETGDNENDTATTSETEELPSKVDNSKYKWFPPIKLQLGGSCSAWASTYYQFTYEMARLYDYNAKNDPEFIASPKYTWNYLNGAHDIGILHTVHSEFINEYGWVSWKDFPQNNTNFDWYDNTNTTTSKLYDALKVSVDEKISPFYPDKDRPTPITSANDSDLYEMKKHLADGNILKITTYSSLEIRQLENNQDVALYTTISDNAHAMNIVGYDDTIYYNLNNDDQKQPYEYGAFLLSNSYGDDWGNEGFIWVMYDAFNKVSNAENLNTDSARTAMNGRRSYYYFDVQKQPVDLAVEVTITQKVRNDFNLYVGASQTLPLEENPPATNQKETINHHGGALNFDGTTSDTYQTRKFMIDCSELYQQNKLNHHYWLYVEDNDITNSSDTYIENIKFVSGGQVMAEFDPDPMSFNVCNLAEEGATKAGYYYSFWLNSIPVAQVEIESPSKKISVGQSVGLSAVTTPAEALNHTVQWSSSNPAVATVNGAGVVTAHAPGNATIVATALGGTNVTSEYTIKVDDHSDAMEEATLVTLHSSTNGTIDVLNDVDYFAFTPSATGKYVIYSTGATDVDAVLYNAQGTVLTKSKHMSADDNNFGITYSLSAGVTYYLEVSGADNQIEGPYAVHVVNNQFSSTMDNLNPDARKVSFTVDVPTVVTRLRVGYGSTTYTINKSDTMSNNTSFSVNCVPSNDGYYSQWFINANLPATAIGSSSILTISALAGNLALTSNQRIRGIIAYGSSYKTNLTPNTYLSSLLSSMATSGYTFTAYNWSDQQITATTTTKVATGQKIVQKNSSGKIVHVYYLVLYGDVAGSGVVGDGLINANDSLKVLKEVEETFLGAISKLAADADHDNYITEDDATLILQHSVGTATINQNVAIPQAVDPSCYFQTPVVF